MFLFTFGEKLYIMYKSAGCGSVWLERTAGGREVAGSNPVTPIDNFAGGIRPAVIYRSLVPFILFRSACFSGGEADEKQNSAAHQAAEQKVRPQ